MLINPIFVRYTKTNNSYLESQGELPASLQQTMKFGGGVTSSTYNHLLYKIICHSTVLSAQEGKALWIPRNTFDWDCHIKDNAL